MQVVRFPAFAFSKHPKPRSLQPPTMRDIRLSMSLPSTWFKALKCLLPLIHAVLVHFLVGCVLLLLSLLPSVLLPVIRRSEAHDGSFRGRWKPRLCCAVCVVLDHAPVSTHGRVL